MREVVRTFIKKKYMNTIPPAKKGIITYDVYVEKSFAHMNDGVIIGRARAMNECMSIA